MAVLKNFDRNELCVSCTCSCDEGGGYRLKLINMINLTMPFLSCTNGKFYYADICMTENEFHQFKAWINRH